MANKDFYAVWVTRHGRADILERPNRGLKFLANEVTKVSDDKYDIVKHMRDVYVVTLPKQVKIPDFKEDLIKE